MIILELAIILIAAKIAGDISVRLGQPTVLGQLLIGVIIGPAVFGFVDASSMISELSTIGVILLMFIAGLETDLQEFRKSLKASTFVGFGGIILPLVGGYYSGIWLGLNHLNALFFGLVLTATSVSISVQVLRELNQLKSKEGMAILGAAVLDDIVVIILLAFLMSFMGGDVSLSSVMLSKVLFFGIAIVAILWVIPYLIKLLAKLKVPQSAVGGAIIICFLFAYFAESTGVAAIIGAYFAGISIGLTKWQDTILEKIDVISYSFFVPIFFVSIGFSAQFTGVGEKLWLVIPLSLLAILAKWAGSGFGAKLAGYGWNSSIKVGAGMVSRGEVALILAALGIEHGIVGSSMFTVLIIVILVTTIVTPPLLKLLYRNDGPAVVEDKSSLSQSL